MLKMLLLGSFLKLHGEVILLRIDKLEVVFSKLSPKVNSSHITGEVHDCENVCN